MWSRNTGMILGCEPGNIGVLLNASLSLVGEKKYTPMTATSVTIMIVQRWWGALDGKKIKQMLEGNEMGGEKDVSIPNRTIMWTVRGPRESAEPRCRNSKEFMIDRAQNAG